MISSQTIENLAPEALLAYSKNAKKHPDSQVAQIAASIEQFGFTVPVLVDGENMIIAGHGRVLAAKKLKLATVPVIRITHLTEEQKRAYVLTDNKLTENGGWDKELLAGELQALLDVGFDMDLTGFSKVEMSELLRAVGSAGLTDPDAAPEAPLAPRSKLGDLWVLGDHRIICGDCTQSEVVDRVLAGAKPHIMVTDPPYGVDYDPSWRKKAGISSKGAAMGAVANDDRADWREAWALFHGPVAYVWHGGLHASTVFESLMAAGLRVRSQIIWVKTRPVISRGAYHWQHEPAFYAVKEAESDQWQDRFEDEHVDAAYAVREGATAQWGGGKAPVDGLDDRAPEKRYRARHPEAGRVHAPANPEQQHARPDRVRAVFGEWHHDHRWANDRQACAGCRVESCLRGRRGGALAGLHRRSGDPGCRRHAVR